MHEKKVARGRNKCNNRNNRNGSGLAKAEIMLFPLFSRFSPLSGRWLHPVTVDEIAALLVRGEIAPTEQLLQWGLSQRCVVEQLVRAVPVPFESAVRATSWFQVLPTGSLHGPVEIGSLVKAAATDRASRNALVLCAQDGARPIPVGWLVPQREPVQPQAPSSEFSWGRVLVGGLALVGGYLLYRKLTEDPEPKRIREIAERYQRHGASVSADIKGWPQPPLLNGRRPDVFAKFSCGFREAVEVENDRSIDRSHARGQIADLARWEARTKRTAFFVDVVKGGRGGKAA